MPGQEMRETELKPFGVEYLEEFIAPEQVAFGGSKACCATFICYGEYLDTGSMTCIDGTDDPC